MLKRVVDLQAEAESVDESGVEMKSGAYLTANGGASGVWNGGGEAEAQTMVGWNLEAR